jgi:hypothetical protein
MGNDCSLRICPFAHAFVDSPQGDLDMSGGALSGPSSTVIVGDEVFPEGTTEQYPDADDDEGHFYMECANKGLCNRKTGDCECFDGYEGTACARTVCPNQCSGHGTCETIQELAEMGTFETTLSHVESTTQFTYSYNLWDQEKSVGCKCDEGYYGADCSERKCKYGVDPLFESEGKRIAAEFRVKTDATGGTFKLKMYDVFGEDYITKDIAYDASVDTFCEAIDILPNGVFDMDRTPDHKLGTHYTDVESDSAYYDCIGSDANAGTNAHNEACCGRNAAGDFYIYLHNNPGPLKTPEFFSSDPTDDHVLGKLTGGTYAIVAHSSFVPGEYMDYFGNQLDLGSQLLPGATAPIGSIDTDVAGDHGFQCSSTSACDAVTMPTFPALLKVNHEVYVATGYESDAAATDGLIVLREDYGNAANNPSAMTVDNVLSAPYVYFASATLTTVADAGTTDTITAPATSAPNSWSITGRTSSYIGTGTTQLAKEDKFTYDDQLYTVAYITETDDGTTYTATIKTVENYIATSGTPSGWVYKVAWDTSDSSNFEYTTQCSNRGVCDSSTGVCKCFKGYSNDNCDTQNAYSL